ncbi:MAG: (Fe-S)-binding protein, partial [bacterium]
LYAMQPELAPADAVAPSSFGAKDVADLSWKNLLDAYSCTECGRCQEACPAFNVNQPLSPKSILIKLLDSIEEHTNNPRNGELVPNYINPESIWSCTTCGACFNSCPVLINPLNKIINLRRNLVMEKGDVPAQLQETLNSIEIRNHPFKGNIDKNQVLNKLKNVKIISNENEAKEVDYIYWIGCAIIYNEQIQNISIKLTEILEKAGLKIGVLKNESCTGDPARRIGNEYLFQIIAQNNINTLKKINKKIITSCPHCYNIIKNEYPQLDEEFKVKIYHHSQILSNLVKENKIKVVDKSLTFHDPCYLGRQNKIFQEPRIVVGKKIKEMEKNKENSFCCGAGGGMYFLEKKEYKKINHERFEQAVKVSNNIATACPYCLLMLQDAANTKGLKDKVIIKDIVEWIKLT